MRLKKVEWAAKTYVEGIFASNPVLWLALIINWVTVATIGVFVASNHGTVSGATELKTAFEIGLWTFIAIPFVINPAGWLLAKWYKEGVTA